MSDTVFSKAEKTYSASALKSLSYSAYNAIVIYEKQAAKGLNPSIEDLAKAVKPCFRAYGMNGWDNASTVVLMLQRIVSFVENAGKKKWKIIGITQFRDVMAKWNDEMNKAELNEETDIDPAAETVRISNADRKNRIDDILFAVLSVANSLNIPNAVERANAHKTAKENLSRRIENLFCGVYGIDAKKVEQVYDACLMRIYGEGDGQQKCSGSAFRKWILQDMLTDHFGVDLSAHHAIPQRKKEERDLEFDEQSIEAECAEGVLSAQEFKRQSFAAYVQYVRLINGEITVEDAIKEMAPLMSLYGFDLTTNNITNVVTVRMTDFAEENGELVRKVKPVSEFRNFIKQGWKEEKVYVRTQIPDVCPVCSAEFKENRINLPVYDAEDKYVGCYICNAVTCKRCGEHYIREVELSSFFERLYKRIGSTIKQCYIKSGDGIRYRIRNDEYLNAEVSQLKFRIEKVAELREQVQEELLGLSPRSFLSKMGYSATKYTNERQRILREAVASYGKRKILDHLEFLIRMRENQRNRDYSEAIAVWEADIEYVIHDI